MDKPVRMEAIRPNRKNDISKNTNVVKQPTKKSEKMRRDTNFAEGPELENRFWCFRSPDSPKHANEEKACNRKQLKNKKKEEEKRKKKETVDGSTAHKKDTSNSRNSCKEEVLHIIAISDWRKCASLEEIFNLPIVSLAGIESFLGGTKTPQKRDDCINSHASISIISKHELSRIDALRSADLDDIQGAADLVGDVFAYLRSQELKYSVPKSYVERYGNPELGSARSSTIDWILGVQRANNFPREALYLAVSLFDRFMLAVPTKDKDARLVALSCLNIALVVEDVEDEWNFADFGKQGKDMEKKVAFALGFQLLQPLSCQFLWHFTQAVPAISETKLQAASYFLELQLVRHEMLHISPSLQAAAALLMSLFVNFDDLSSEIDNMCNAHRVSTWILEDSPSTSDSNMMETAISSILKELWSPTIRFVTTISFNEVMKPLKLLAVVIIRGHKSAVKDLEEISEAIVIVNQQLTLIETIQNFRKTDGRNSEGISEEFNMDSG